MKPKIIIPISMALFLATAVGWSQTTFFSDNFSNGSTTNGISTPGGTPTASSTSYDFASSKTSVSSIGAKLLRSSLATNTTSGYWEAQALFSTNGVSLNTNGDYIEMDIVFTNSTGTLFAGSASPIWVGLFNSASVSSVLTNYPVPFAQLANGGLNTTPGSSFASGNCEPWQGYVGQINTGAGSRIITRPVQNGSNSTSANQELLGNGASGGTFANPGATVLITSASQTFTLATNVAYTASLRITLDPAGTGNLIISNALYLGAGTVGTPLMTNNINTSTVLATAFDGLAFGAFSHNGSTNPLMDVSSITIIGQSSPPTLPNIKTQPVPLVVATNGFGEFTVSATGANLRYQWFRNGAAMINGGNISGATSPTVGISSASTADQFSGAAGYYCTVTGAGNLSTNTVTNSLSLVPATNLLWAGNAGNGNWDVQTTVNWKDTNNNPAVFTGGDPVLFSDAANPTLRNVAVIGNVSPASMYVATASEFSFAGSGAIVGPAAVVLDGDASASVGEVVINNANNTYSGGTTLTNGIYLQLENYGGIGTGPLNLVNPSGDLEVVPSGSSSSGIQGQVNVNDDSTILVDNDGSFALVLLNNLAGVSGKTLTIAPAPVTNPNTNQWRVRVYGTSTVYNGNLSLSDANVLFATYAASGSQTYNGIVSGPGAFMEKGTTTIFNGANTYAGGTTPAQGEIGLGVSSTSTSGPIGTGPILLAPDSTTSTTGAGFLFAANNGNIIISNAIEYVSSTNNLTLEVGGTNNLTLAGPFTLLGNDNTIITNFPTRSFNVTNTALTMLNGKISDGGSNYNFNLTGNGVTLFNNTEAYGGLTTNNGGTMLVNGQVGPGAVVVLTNSASAGGTNAMAFLGGTGTITGPVSIQAGGTLTAGTQTTAHNQGIGTLHLNSSLTFTTGSTNFVQVNTSLGTPNTVINVTGAVTYNGTLYAQNVGPALSAGNHFTIVNAGSESGSFTTIAGSPGPGLAWQFTPASGVLSVVTGISPFTVKPYISSIAISSGTNIIMTGTNAQANAIYYMLTSTNLLLPISQWSPVGTNITSVANNFSFTNNAAHPGEPKRFYILSNTNF